MNARERIFNRLRAAPTVPNELPDVGAWFNSQARNENQPQRVARLRAALEASHAEVIDTSFSDWHATLFRIATAKGICTLLVGADFATESLSSEQHNSELRLIHYNQPIEAWRDTLFDQVDAGLTLAKSAIAETGSLVLWPDANEPRLMSLVPPIHFVLLDASTIHSDLHSAMVQENWKDNLPSNALLISGPSKTADIQQTLAYGAHGPRELIVLLRHAEGATA